MSYLVDTSWLVEHLRNNQEAIARLDSFTSEGLAISIVSLAELQVGVFRSSNQTRAVGMVNRLISTLDLLALDEPVCIRFGREKAALLDRGQLIGDADLLIAATALHHGLTLLTLDRDFERVDNLQTIYLA